MPFFGGVKPICPHDNCGSSEFRVVKWDVYGVSGEVPFIVCSKCNKIIAVQEYLNDERFMDLDDTSENK